jgi:hypothetical protein
MAVEQGRVRLSDARQSQQHLSWRVREESDSKGSFKSQTMSRDQKVGAMTKVYFRSCSVTSLLGRLEAMVIKPDAIHQCFLGC